MQTNVAVHSVLMLDLPLFKRFSSVLMYSMYSKWQKILSLPASEAVTRYCNSTAGRYVMM